MAKTTEGQSPSQQVITEKGRQIQNAATSLLSGSISLFGSIVGASYSLIKLGKDTVTNSAFCKYQIIGQNFEGQSIPDGILLPIPQYQTAPINASDLFHDVNYSNCNFKAANLGQIFIAENIQFHHCMFDEYTNFIGLAYHTKLGDDVIRGRITNSRNNNGNTGGEKAILTVSEANERLKNEFVKNGQVDDQSCIAHLDFVYGLINIATLITGQKPYAPPKIFDPELQKGITLSGEDLQAITEFKALANKIAQHFPEELQGAFPANKQGHVGYLDAPGYYELKTEALPTPDKPPVFNTTSTTPAAPTTPAPSSSGTPANGATSIPNAFPVGAEQETTATSLAEKVKNEQNAKRQQTRTPAQQKADKGQPPAMY